jgi:hypothetical protein
MATTPKEPAPPAAAAAFVCRTCGGKDLRVRYTRNRGTHILRVRYCTACRTRMTTRERPV